MYASKTASSKTLDFSRNSKRENTSEMDGYKQSESILYHTRNLASTQAVGYASSEAVDTGLGCQSLNLIHCCEVAFKVPRHCCHYRRCK